MAATITASSSSSMMMMSMMILPQLQRRVVAATTAAAAAAKKIVLPPFVASRTKNNNASSFLFSSTSLAVATASLFLGGATTVSNCESPRQKNDNTNIMDIVLPKNPTTGTIYWDKAGSQITDKVFWDKLAKATGNQIQDVIDTGIPTTISYSFMSGFCSGYALKKVGRAVSVVLGLGFISLQTLHYYGYINVDHQQIQKDVENILDLNKDGKVDTDDLKEAQSKILEVLQFNLPAGGGFAAGFFGGIRTG